MWVRLFSYLADISYTWCRLIPQPLHRCYRGFTEVRGLSIHHLHHHDSHRPDVHLEHHQAVKLQYVTDPEAQIATVGIYATWEWSPLLLSVRACEFAPPHLSAIWWFGDDLRSHPIGCPHERLPLRDVFADLSAEAKVWKLDLRGKRERLYYWERNRSKERNKERKHIIPFRLKWVV